MASFTAAKRLADAGSAVEVLANVSVWNGSTIDKQNTLIIENATITDNVKDSQHIPKELKGFDCSGLFVVPGLIDMHVHLTLDPDRTLQEMIAHPHTDDEVALTIARNLKEVLQNGITTVRDLGARRAYNPLFATHLSRSNPRILLAGEMITAVDGHGTESAFRMAKEVDTVDAARAAVRDQHAAGSSLIKLVTCGASTQAELTLDQLAAAVRQAHSLGLKVACHAHFRRDSIKNALDAGVDTLEHGCVLDSKLVNQMLSQGTYYCPTLYVIKSALDYPDQYGGRDSTIYKAIKSIVKSHEASFRLAYQRGVKIIAGTDAGLPNVHFSSLHAEFETMLRFGMSTADILRTATSVAADALGLGSVLGRVTPGCCADLLFVESNPLEEIGALRYPRAVMRNGEVVFGSLPRL